MADYRFTEDDFSQNIPHWERMLVPLYGKADLRFLEVGSCEGRSTVWLLEHILTDENSRIDCVDLFNRKDREELFDHNIGVTQAQHKVTKLKGRSQAILRTLPFEHYDAVYIDGSHYTSAVLEDIVLAFPLLKTGGLLILDDYRMGDKYKPMMQPKLAIDAFMHIYQMQYELIYMKYQIILKKGLTSKVTGFVYGVPDPFTMRMRAAIGYIRSGLDKIWKPLQGKAIAHAPSISQQ